MVPKDLFFGANKNRINLNCWLFNEDLVLFRFFMIVGEIFMFMRPIIVSLRCRNINQISLLSLIGVQTQILGHGRN